MKKRQSKIVILLILFFFIPYRETFPWHDETHIAIAKAAGYELWYNVTGPDVARLKLRDRESYNHFYNNPGDEEVTPSLVLSQAHKYDNPRDREGHLYGAIIATLRDYIRKRSEGRFARYDLAYCFHYIGDLSQPLHNVPYDEFNKEYHRPIEEIADEYVKRNGIEGIKKYMYEIKIDTEDPEKDIACHIARIANLARELGKKIKDENRVMTEEEVLTQLGHSASLIKGILKYLRHKFPVLDMSHKSSYNFKKSLGGVYDKGGSG